MTSLKNKFITWIICYTEKQTWNRPAGLQLFKKETPTQVFSCGISETFKHSGGCFWKHVTYYLIKIYIGHKLAIFKAVLLLYCNFLVKLVMRHETHKHDVAWLYEERADSRNVCPNEKKYCSCCIIWYELKQKKYCSCCIIW